MTLQSSASSGDPLTLSEIRTEFGTFPIDISTATTFNYTLTGAATTFSFTNPPASGNNHTFTVITKQSSSTTVTPSWTNVKWAGGIVPPITLVANAVDIWSFMTLDGGTTYYGSLSVKDAK